MCITWIMCHDAKSPFPPFFLNTRIYLIEMSTKKRAVDPALWRMIYMGDQADGCSVCSVPVRALEMTGCKTPDGVATNRKRKKSFFFASA